MEALKKLIEKKKAEGKELDPMYKDSKMSMLKMLRNEMSGMMKDDLTPKKVEVAANDAEGLKEGLDKAQNLIGDEGGEAVDDDGDGMMMSPDELMAKYKADPSEENMMKLMECLEQMKAPVHGSMEA